MILWGIGINFIVSYVKIKDFSAFWTKYINHIKELNTHIHWIVLKKNLDEKNIVTLILNCVNNLTETE